MDHKIKRPNGRWVPAVATDIRKTFERERARLKTKGTRFYLRDEKEL